MSGALLASITAATAGGGGGGGGDVTPDAVSWPNCAGAAVAATGAKEITGINTAITLDVSWTGSGTVSVVVNSTVTALSNPGAVTVHNTDEVGFYIGTPGTAGTITVKNASDGDVTLSSFTYAVYYYGFVPGPPPIPSH